MSGWTTWVESGACGSSDHDDFFTQELHLQRAATEVCLRDCPVITQCLGHALRAPEDFGIWGGTTERERRRLTSILKRDGVPLSDQVVAAIVRDVRLARAPTRAI